MLGITGRCRREELYSMTVDDIQDTGTQLVITIPYTKTNVRRTFSVINEAEGINFLEMFRKYTALRPKNLQEKMFVCNRTRNELFACVQQAAKLNFAAVALTTAVKVKVIFIFIYYHNYNISICRFPV
jgi:hypothetical protein